MRLRVECLVLTELQCTFALTDRYLLNMVKCELTWVSVREKKVFIILACLKVHFVSSFEAKKDT